MAWGLIALVLSAGLAMVAYGVTRDQLVSERERSATSQAYLNARLARSALRSTGADLGEVLSSLEGNSGSVVLARVSGEWYSSSVGIGPNALPPSLVEAAGSGLAGRQMVRIGGEPFVAVGLAVPAVDAQYFELVPMDDIERTLDGLRGRLALGAALAALVGAGAGWYASGRVLRPLRRFASAAERIAEGSLDTRLEAIADPDLRVLERTFNQMAGAVQERIDREARFSAHVSHELRAPIAALFSIIGVARRRDQEPADLVRTLDEMEGRVRDLHDLIEDLLEISRIEAGAVELQLEPVDPALLIEALLARMGRTDLPVDLRCQPGTTLRADKRRVAQMLQNLVDNADRYGGGATRLEVACTDGAVCFAVEDEGPGVPEEERAYIFERFARGAVAVERGSGTGLGLALVAEHAALHGGTVQVEDRAGGGARFVVTLPVGDES